MSSAGNIIPQPDDQAIVPASKQGLARVGSFAPTNLAEAMNFSSLIANSDLAPKDFKGKPGNVLIAIQMGAEVGLSPMQAIQNIAVINGRPCLWGDAALAVVQAHSAYEWHKEFMEGQGKERVAVFQIKRKGHELHESRFSVMNACTAQLWGKTGPWTQYPDRMQQMRARGFGLRDKFADALRGLSIAEEAIDLPVGQTIDSDAPTMTQPQLPAAVAMPRRKSEPEAITQPEPEVRPAEKVQEVIAPPVEQFPLSCPDCGSPCKPEGCNFCGWMPATATELTPTPEPEPQRQAAPQHTAPASGPVISEKQDKRLFAISMGAGVTKQELNAYLMKRFGVAKSADIPKSGYEEACAWAERGGK